MASSIWLDVENASGTRYGQPITTATGWTSTRRLDAAGTFSFTMPASDPRAALLAHKRIVRCWEMSENGVVERGSGIIDHIEVAPNNSDAPTMLVVSGDDLLRELVYRTVGDLNLYDDVVAAATRVQMSFANGDPSTTVTLPAAIDLAPGPANFFNIGYAESFSRIDFTLTSANGSPGLITVQFYNLQNDRWESVSNVLDTTILNGNPFGQTGYISFDPPSGWGKQDGRYVVRIHCRDTDPGSFTVSAITLHQLLPTADALQKVMALAPPGWTLDAAGAFATESDVYLPLSGGSVLAVLGRLAAQTGEHFRLGTSGRRVLWLGSVAESSGLQAIAAAEPSAATMLIKKDGLIKSSDSYELFNRFYFYGGGSGDSRLTLAATSRTAPSGYVLSKTGSYLQHTASQGEYGRIDSTATFSDITPADISASALTRAANSLFDRGYQMLRRKCGLQYAYDLTVIPAAVAIYPGQTVHVTYDEWTEDYHAVAIDDDLVVLETITKFDNQGVCTVGLKVATVDFWPQNDHRTVAQSLGDIATDRSLAIPQSGLESAEVGIPTYLAVSAGMVVGLNRVIPVADGVYDPVDRLVIQSGVITYIGGGTR